jgi:hypothetical protein
MATKKITQLNELATPALTDILPIVDDPAASAETKKVTVENLLTTPTPSLTATGDVHVGSGLVVGSAGDDPGAGEVWLVEQSSAPAGTSDRLKLVNSTNKLVMVDESGTVERLSGESGVTLFLDGGTEVITTGDKLFTEAPFDCVVLGWVVVGDAVGSINATVQKTSYVNFPASFVTVANPVLSSLQKGSASLSNQTFSKGDVIKVNVASVSTFKKVAVTLRVRKV